MNIINRLTITGPWQQLGYLLLLLGLFLCRIPDVIMRPQFWAEDGAVFFNDAFASGAASIVQPYKGYYHLVPRLTALLGSLFDPSYAPAIFVYASIGLTALVLWLVLSPRLPLPYKPFLALLVVLSPHSGEVYANITNIQWFLPFGVLAILLMVPHPQRLYLYMEMLYIFLAGLTGPFVLLLFPAFLVKAWSDRHSPEARRRTLALLIVAGIIAVIQIVILTFSNSPASLAPLRVEVLLPVIFVHFFGAFILGTVRIFTHIEYFSPGAIKYWVLLLLLIAVVYYVAIFIKSSYKVQLTILAYSAIAILASCLYRSGSNQAMLDYYQGNRYFFITVILAAWILVISLKDRIIRYPSLVLLLSLMISTTVCFKRAPFIDYNWPMWAGAITRNKPLTIPINPPGWSIIMNSGNN